MCTRPPRRKAGFRMVPVALLTALLLLAGHSALQAATRHLPAAPEQTPTAPYNALLPIVAGSAPSPTPTATLPPTATQPPTQPPTEIGPSTSTPGPMPTASPTASSTPEPGATTAPDPSATATQAPSPERSSAEQLYATYYLPALAAYPEWTGNVENCAPGTISAARLAALEQQVNYFRLAAGVPPIAFDATMNARAQAAALIMAAEGDLSHTPPSSWQCWSEEGSAGAGASNLGLSYGYDIRRTVIGFMNDPGSGNISVGHREWLLAPPTAHMGAGEAQGTQWDASAIHVVDPAAAYYDTWPATRDGADGFVAWPPPGYIPFEVVYPRWSLFLRGADFSAATVAMQLDGKPVSSSIIYAEASGNRSALPDWKGLVWEPALDLDALERATTHRVDVTIGNVQRSTGPQTYNYTVLLFAPE